jgi:NTP pyrophosphatase (non-canonical NTP hydrolase)
MYRAISYLRRDTSHDERIQCSRSKPVKCWACCYGYIGRGYIADGFKCFERLAVATMNANDYQREAARTHIDAPGFDLTPQETMATWYALKLSGEVGELANHIGKGIYHRHGVSVATVQEECGDIAWYLAGICTLYGISLDDVLAQNIAKLQKRYPDGYSSAASKARVDLPKPSDWSHFQRGDTSFCSSCNDRIQFDGYAWRHLGIIKPRHIALPTIIDGVAAIQRNIGPSPVQAAMPAIDKIRAADQFLSGALAVARASVRSPLPGDMAVCLHCQEQIAFTQYGVWRHTTPAPFPPDEHAAEPHPF